MPKPAFIVDGYMEQAIVQRLCPNLHTRIVRNDLNGKTATIPAIAKRLTEYIKLLKNYHPIVILIDREEKLISFEEMSQQIQTVIIAETNLNPNALRIGVADRMTENWILADWQTLTGGVEAVFSGTDGIKNADSKIEDVKGSYDKTTDGVDLFTKADPSVIYANSPSFKHFVDQLHDIDCPYLHFNKK